MIENRLERYVLERLNSAPDDYNVYTGDGNQYLGNVAQQPDGWYVHVVWVYDPDEFGPVATLSEALDLLLAKQDA